MNMVMFGSPIFQYGVTYPSKIVPQRGTVSSALNNIPDTFAAPLRGAIWLVLSSPMLKHRATKLYRFATT